mmetsp:Transcript_26411/g.71386  ORF Transcript_26411/g.71386 Transcript_26411/m.71386 type:complete len:167 (-) Transcript_26411:367-867(-)
MQAVHRQILQPCQKAVRTRRRFACSGISESSGFGNNLRKGFQPQKKPPSKPPKTSPNIQEVGNKAVLANVDQSEGAWREVDKKLNEYPGYRTFTAIGTGGAEFKASMVSAVESVLGEVQEDRVTERPSSGGQYLSVKIGPVVVMNPDQVIQVFACIKADKRLKWMM